MARQIRAAMQATNIALVVLVISSQLVCFVAAADDDGNTTSQLENDADEVKESEPFVALLFPWFAQLLGVISLHLISRFAPDLPYTAVLFALGVVMGVVEENSNGFGQLGQSIIIWTNIDPHLLLFAFLPALLFGDALEVKWYLFKRSFWQVIWLAFPGMLLGTVLTALVAYYVFPYGWSFELCMTFGSILAATDPVAVVALLKEVGASPALTMLISGESMLNDGTAIVMFTIFSQMFLKQMGDTEALDVDVGIAVKIFVQQALGGMVLGVLFGVLTIMWLTWLNRKLEEQDSVMQLSLTITVAYLSYYVADGMLKCSGVLCVILCGIVVSAFGRPLFHDEEKIEHVWHAIEHLGNTLLFVLGGAVWGFIVAEQADGTGYIDARDWGYLLLLYIMVTLVRGFLFLTSFPLISRIGLGATWQDAVFMTWGGLRGAVGIALALALDNEAKGSEDINEEAKRFTSQIIFHVGGLAFLTLAVNGLSSSWVLRKLELTGTSEARKHVLNAVHDKAVFAAQRALERAIETERFSCANREKVMSLVPALRPLYKQIEQEREKVAIRTKLAKLSFPKFRANTATADHTRAAPVPAPVSTVAVAAMPQREDHAIADTKSMHGITTKGSEQSDDAMVMARHAASDGNQECYTEGMIFPEMVNCTQAGRERRASTTTQDRRPSTDSVELIQHTFTRRRSATQLEPQANILSQSQRRLKHIVSKRRMSMRRVKPHKDAYKEAVHFHELVVTLREVFLDILRASYWVLIREGVLREDSFAAYVLLQSCDMAARPVANGRALDDWAMVVAASNNSMEYRIDRFIGWMMGKAPLANYNDVAYKQEQLRIHTSLCFIQAHIRAQHELKEFYRRIERQGSAGSTTFLEGGLREDDAVIAESQQGVMRAAKVLDSSDPEVVASTVNKTVAAIALDAQGKYIKRAKEEGMIQEKEAQALMQEVTAQLGVLHWANHHRLKTDPKKQKRPPSRGSKTGAGGWFAYVAKEHSELKPFRSIAPVDSVGDFSDAVMATMAASANNNNSNNNNSSNSSSPSNGKGRRERRDSEPKVMMCPPPNRTFSAADLHNMRRVRSATADSSSSVGGRSAGSAGANTSDMMKMLHMDAISTIHPGHSEERMDLLESSIADHQNHYNDSDEDDADLDLGNLEGLQVVGVMDADGADGMEGLDAVMDVVVHEDGPGERLRVIPEVRVPVIRRVSTQDAQGGSVAAATSGGEEEETSKGDVKGGSSSEEGGENVPDVVAGLVAAQEEDEEIGRTGKDKTTDKMNIV